MCLLLDELAQDVGEAEAPLHTNVLRVHRAVDLLAEPQDLRGGETATHVGEAQRARCKDACATATEQQQRCYGPIGVLLITMDTQGRSR